MSARSFRLLLWCGYWAAYAALVAVALAAKPMGWSAWLGDLAVATAFTLTLPLIVHHLTGGSVSAWFARLRHRRWWFAVYVATCIAIFAPRLGWSGTVPLLFGAAALAGAAWLGIGRRPLLAPKDR